MRRFKMCNVSQSFLVLSAAIACATWTNRADAASWSLTSVKDNTLYEYDPNDYDPNDSETWLHSNGSGNFFSAGRNRKRSEIRRGLLQFDLSAIPAGETVIEGSARLDMYVVDVPTNDPAARSVWLTRLVGLAQPWGEGASATTAGVSGAGSGAPAQANDATWFHASYDPNVHDQTTFTPGGAGFWTQQGALGNAPLDTWSSYGNPAATLESVTGPGFLSSASMESDINAWIQGNATNFGWTVLGDETVEGDKVSSNRGFATREHAFVDFRPTLTFETVSGPIAPMAWDGGDGNWSDNNWNGTNPPITNADVTIDATAADSFVEVTDGVAASPAIHLTVGETGSETLHSELVVRGGNTLEVIGTATADQYGTISVENGATLQTGSAVADSGGSLISGVQGADCGLLDVHSRLSLEGADSVHVDWIPGVGEPSKFGGTYTIARYANGILAGGGTLHDLDAADLKTSNSSGNIGVAYIADVRYAEPDWNGMYEIQVDLHPQKDGDLDLNGEVAFSDLSLLLDNWGIGNTWAEGDIDFTGGVEFSDLSLLLDNWGTELGTPSSSRTGVVPEPGALVMLMMAAAGMLIHRRRRARGA